MLLDHQNATANLTIDGLAICCFNSKQWLWEVGFMRHPEHQLLIHLDDKSEPIAVPADARVVRIETQNGEQPDYKSFPRGFFDFGPVADRKRDAFTLSMEERENFRWAMNLDEGKDVPHGQIKLKRPKYGTTMVYISDAVFYTANVTPKDVFLVPRASDPKTMSEKVLNQHLYGKTADQIGADIKCREGGGIRITMDDSEVAWLPHQPGQPRAVSLMNMRADQSHGVEHDNAHMAAAMPMSDLEQGDFQIYYDAMDVTKDQYSLWGHSNGIVMSGRTDCNTPWVGGDSLAGMAG